MLIFCLTKMDTITGIVVRRWSSIPNISAMIQPAILPHYYWNRMIIRINTTMILPRLVRSKRTSYISHHLLHCRQWIHGVVWSRPPHLSRVRLILWYSSVPPYFRRRRQWHPRLYNRHGPRFLHNIILLIRRESKGQ